MIIIDGTHLTIEDVVRVARFAEPVGLSPHARQRMQLSRGLGHADRRLPESRVWH